MEFWVSDLKETFGKIIFPGIRVSGFPGGDDFRQKRSLCLDLVEFAWNQIFHSSTKINGILHSSPKTNRKLHRQKNKNPPSFGPWVCSEGSTCLLIFPGRWSHYTDCSIKKSINNLTFRNRNFILHFPSTWCEVHMKRTIASLSITALRHNILAPFLVFHKSPQELRIIILL